MGLNIKNQRVHDLARRAADVTGKTQTGAIEEALVRLLADYGDDETRRRVSLRVDLIHDIAARYDALDVPAANDVIGSVDDLYDDALGLPR